MDNNMVSRSFEVATLSDGRTRLTIREGRRSTHQIYPVGDDGFRHAILDGAAWSMRQQITPEAIREPRAAS